MKSAFEAAGTISGVVAVVVMAAVAQPAMGQVPDPGGTLTVGELLTPCVEGAEDARWGTLLLTACDQYLRGFRDTWQALAGKDARTRLCLPGEPDPIGQLRRAFVRWATQNIEAHEDPAVSGLIRAVRERFPCE